MTPAHARAAYESVAVMTGECTPIIVEPRIDRVSITRPAYLLNQWREYDATVDRLNSSSRDFTAAEDATYNAAERIRANARRELREWLTGIGCDPDVFAEAVS